jgi:hypothetical protein
MIVRSNTHYANIDDLLPYDDLYNDPLPYGDNTPMDDLTLS